MNYFLCLPEDIFLTGKTRHDKSIFGKELIGSSGECISLVDHYGNAGFFRSHEKIRRY